MSQIAKYDKYLDDKMQEIRERLSGKKVKIDISKIGTQKQIGRDKSIRAKIICETFGISKSTYDSYRSGRSGIEKQRLYAIWYSLPLEIFEDLQELIK